MLQRQFPCYDLQRLRNLLAALALAAPEQRSRAMKRRKSRHRASETVHAACIMCGRRVNDAGIFALTSPPTKDLLDTPALVLLRTSAAVVQSAPGPALALPTFKAPIHLLIPIKTSDAVAAVTVVLSTGVGR